jgi:hypothetical protein
MRELARIAGIGTGLLLLAMGCGGAQAASAPAAWEIETVDHTGPGRYTSMRIDKDGNAHLVYVIEEADNSLKYAFWDHALKRWFTMLVDRSVGACSLTLDSRQRPHISYADAGTASGSKLHYAYWDGVAWKKEALRLNSDVIAYYSSISLDADDHPSLTFYEYRGPKGSDLSIRLRNVMFNGSVWDVRTVDGTAGSGKFNSMAAGPDGFPRIAYANVAAGTESIRYAAWNGTSWTPEIIEGLQQNNGEAVGYSAAIAVYKDGTPHIAYMNESLPQLRYAVRRNGKWQIKIVGRLAGIGYPDRNSIALDNDGNPYVGYYDAGNATLKLAFEHGGEWVVGRVDSGGGFTSSVQIANGEIWISYTDDSNSGVKVAKTQLRALWGLADVPKDGSADARK